MAEIWVSTSLKKQAIGEAIAYTVDYTDVGTPSSGGTLVCINSTGGDVSSTLLTGSVSLSSNTVTFKLFTPVTAGYYRLINSVTISGNTVKGGIEVDVYDPAATQAISNVYCTLAEFKHYAKLENTDTLDDGVVSAIIEGVSRVIDDICGRTFYARSETRYYSVPEEGRELRLDDDLLTITTLTNGDGTVLTTADYYFFPRNQAPYRSIWLKDTSSYYWSMNSSGSYEYVITVAGTWGYSSTAPADIRQACLELSLSQYKRRFGENLTQTSTITTAGIVISPQDIPGGVWNMLRKYRART